MNRFLVICNAVAFLITLLFWSLIVISHRVLFPWEEIELLRRSASAVTYGFAMGDLLCSLPMTFLAALGLSRKSSLGWTAAMVANGLWIYSMTVIIIRDLFTLWSPGSILFMPFLVVAIITTPWLWNHRQQYGIQ